MAKRKSDAAYPAYQLPTYPFVKPPELHGRPAPTYPVVIVGAGLSGLTLACRLAQLGVAAVLLDEDNTVGVKGASSRGICYTQQSLEIFSRLGIYDRIAAKGVAWQTGRTFAGDDEVFSFDLRERQQFSHSVQPPFINIQQFYVEMFLVERIQALNQLQPLIDLRWNNRVTAFSQNDVAVTLQVQTPRFMRGWVRPWTANEATTVGALPMCASNTHRLQNATPGLKHRSTTTARFGNT